MPQSLVDRRARPAQARFSRWRAADGWRIRRMDWLQPAEAEPRGSLIFGGGRGDFIEKYLEAKAHWHALGWNVTSFDWRGQGGSAGDIVAGHIEDFDPLVEDGAALIASWIAERPGPHAAIGHSFGGHLLLRILAEHRPRLDAAVLSAPMLGFNARKLPRRLAGAIAALAARLGWRRRPVWKEGPKGGFRQANLTSSLERYADESWWKENNPRYDLGPPSWGWLAAAYRSMARHDAAGLRAVATPVLLIGSDSDRLVSPAAIRRAASLMPKAELHMFADAAHEILRERDEVRLEAHALIDDFLDRHAGR
ncbi:MAG: alpha/beta hydrolase [Sphingomonadaceae bacterium]